MYLSLCEKWCWKAETPEVLFSGVQPDDKSNYGSVDDAKPSTEIEWA